MSTTPSHNTSVPILKTTDQQSSPAAGIAGGVVGAIIVVIILLIAVLFVRRRFPEFFKKKPIEQHFNHNNYIGNQNVAFVLPSEASIHNNITDYSMLGSTRDQHYYQRISDSQNEATGSEPHTYVTLYDSLEGRNLSCSCDTDEITTFEEPGENRKSRDVDQQQKQYDYANLAAENPTDNTNIVNEYAILDPGVTGFDRCDIETCDDLQIYELAKPITEVSEVDKTSQEDDGQYMPSVEGVYDHAHNNRHKKPITNIYDKKTNSDYEKPTMNKNESHESTYYNA